MRAMILVLWTFWELKEITYVECLAQWLVYSRCLISIHLLSLFSVSSPVSSWNVSLFSPRYLSLKWLSQETTLLVLLLSTCFCLSHCFSSWWVWNPTYSSLQAFTFIHLRGSFLSKAVSGSISWFLQPSGSFPLWAPVCLPVSITPIDSPHFACITGSTGVHVSYLLS